MEKEPTAPVIQQSRHVRLIALSLLLLAALAATMVRLALRPRTPALRPAAVPNALLITADTVRADHIVAIRWVMPYRDSHDPSTEDRRPGKAGAGRPKIKKPRPLSHPRQGQGGLACQGSEILTTL
jgi:hypothetical protein